MKKAITVVATILISMGIMIGSTALPASAGQWPPGVVYRSTYGGCTVDVISGDYGQSFGNIDTVSSGCQDVKVQITAVVGGGTFTTPWCDLAFLLFHPGDPNGHPFYCTFHANNGIIGVQAHIPGSSGWLVTRFVLCTSVSNCSSIRELSLL